MAAIASIEASTKRRTGARVRQRSSAGRWIAVRKVAHCQHPRFGQLIRPGHIKVFVVKRPSQSVVRVDDGRCTHKNRN